MSASPSSLPRGRHAPPREARIELQRTRLIHAACSVFCASGFAEASVEAISREAGMSKATFYEHFDNKLDCMEVILDEAADAVLRRIGDAACDELAASMDRHRVCIRAFLELVAEHPLLARTTLIESVGAGPVAMQRRDALMDAYAITVYEETLACAERLGGPHYASADDAFAIAGATIELISRQLRTGRPERVTDLEPILARLVSGILVLPDA